VQFVKCCAIYKVISSAAHLVKRAIDQMCATAIPSEAIHSRKIKLQLSDNILFKTFAKSRPISEELVSLYCILCCYLLKCYNAYWMLFLFFPS